ncbi:DNA translocase FtsK [Psychrobacillus sp. FJAT-51614]|uniref:DNA translocase FtsK n=1 Tax=Psychrobacillus mangrovi TaxID=3117745 RepID=A0ABU8F2K8_9BACI
MNWFKKLFATNEVEDKETEQVAKQEVFDTTSKTKTPFRFPLIPDEEKDQFLFGEPKVEKVIEPMMKEKHKREDETYKPLHTRELWQQRKQQSVVHRAPKKEIPVAPRTPKKEVIEGTVNERRKKAFTPTQVPSPVFGFSKRQENKIDETSEQTKFEQVTHKEPTALFSPTQVPSPVFGFSKRQENKVEEPIETIQVERELVMEETAVTIAPTQAEVDEVEVTPIVSETIAEAEDKAVEVMDKPLEIVEETPKVEMKETAVTVAPTQAEVDEVEVAPIVSEPIAEAEDKAIEVMDNPIEIGEETKDTPKENIRPFNVLMLKSDKEKVNNLVKETTKIAPTQAEVDEAEVAPIVSEPLGEVEDKAVEVMDNPIEIVEETKVTPKENIRPFNVLMLKSDKEKMNKLVEETTMIAPEIKAVATQPFEDVKKTQSQPEHSEYERPDLNYLLPPEMKNEDTEWMEEQAFTLIEALSHFQVSGEIVQMFQGPAVTQFEITVGHGTKVSKIRNLADDLKLALAAKDIRIQAPIPGKSSIGIEIPNRKSRAVRLSEVINSSVFLDSDSPLEAALGLNLTGKPVTLDLRKMPHGLIAGATGSGKSVFINSLLVSLLYKATPEEVKLLLIDPKMVELAPFNHIPHLVSPVITDVKAATAALKWAVDEMERRYQLFAHIGVRDISRYNTLATEKRQFAQKLPYIVIVIDELADLMMMAPTEVEDAICRIAQKARACGIHLVLATQRPSVDVITGLIKANIPTRIAFSVSSQIDSRTILDQQGAERLLGKGDMLYQGNGMSSPVRIQGTFVTDDEIENVIDYARTQGTPEYMFEQEELLQKAENVTEQDEIFEEACRFVVEQGSASTSLLQRKFHLGYNRAARLIDAMYENGYITEQKGSKAREVLLTNESLEQIFS